MWNQEGNYIFIYRSDIHYRKEVLDKVIVSFKKFPPWEFPGGLVVRDLVLSLLWSGFVPWPGNLCILVVAQKTPNKQKSRVRSKKFPDTELTST